MQNAWLSKKADEIQSFADRQNMKKFFDALKTVYGPRAQKPPHFLVQMELVKRWAEHFDGVIKWPPSINDETINRLPPAECNPLLDELPTVSERVKAI